MYSRNDGVYLVYTIQHQQKDGEWVFSSNHYGTPPKTTDDFSACGKCWQVTGQFGVFDWNAAMQGLIWSQQRNPAIEFRLVSVRFSQETAVIFEDQSQTCKRCHYYSPYGSDEMGQCLNPSVIGSSAANRLRGAEISEGFAGGVHPEGCDVDGVCFHKDFGCRHFWRSK